MTLLVPQADGIPLPRTSPLTQPFWDACKEHRLLYQRCAQCDQPVFNPAPICPHCLSRELAWHEGAGRGAVYSWTVAHRPMTPAFTTPYAAIIVDLDEGYQMVSNLVGCDTDVLAVGLRVRVDFHTVGAMALPYFTPDD